MSGRVTQLWRYPVKSHGREALGEVTLTKAQTLPWDRVWAVAHDSSVADGSEWVPCQNFSIGTKAPSLAAINAELDEATGCVRLTHPEIGTLEFDPDTEGEKLVAWAGPLIPENRAQSERVIRASQRGFTDTPFPSVSLMNAASHKAVEDRLGHALEAERWRGNIWLEGFAPWEEFDWIGKRIEIGAAELEIKERVIRCKHTTASPKSGERDTDTLALLKDGWGHQDFGVYAEVTRSGLIKRGDKAKVL
ncbi:MOSC domain-containing protein [Lentibacter sp. XHP0401]|jgi:MOSC domain-containing protein|uniref:MOSC domain-containing protein n=1 Tax=Lentibacter sp. XHP0401 TaxID=2984334 RepID=UPI0021E7F198|nr:MOSC N-terminal beta barrel domain-containing protein [Lentibacter sp. XHP0401]MCV2892847.1 MOSC N-terminal beta barrel domain-containing protein [Lentibacter sp. XHP0401]